MGVLNRLAWGASDSFAVCMGLASTMVCMPEKYCGCSDDALVVAAVALYIACPLLQRQRSILPVALGAASL